ncbi:gentisate 1,2-dioxygenase [Xenorhabdus bovienii]|uniref:gentisate 1,2-dioxygenase n=1 Tax=Xenorhabdus bovienii TaxID=40576 RepID=UPI0023B27D61|nr:gentisate 1,2-dioxygenase [Xenorhabdus bovienii]MDE9431777.1 gentisate 1,2-dioxygenase [Xenorhabdus bovienii]MDE9434834.1 gentisate 1,2-dioxygenase [Xenorhabdus bovienii]MDE9489503.1 gentisate 1,2-dioxygenase [Xenorhabdus bovienii]MDE9505806.1 gentisate 1,2-dioxygenase [Xenorhabdus bovienii]MDE9545935.1 gentisate 1,2-dioxygenase [Xenorhabdus bovienii]
MQKINTRQLDRRKNFYQDIAKLNLSPLWEELHRLVPDVPHSSISAALWRYQDIRPFLMESGELIGAREAIRRVLVLENPALIGKSSITSSLYAGLQLIMPGEIAPSHRHSQSALRFIVEGSGAFTAVNGERTMMEAGDFILTPQWQWHDHGNPGTKPVIWLDGLDLPLVNSLGCGFAEDYPEEQQPVLRSNDDYLPRYAANMLPVRYQSGNSSPIFNYRYDRSREALEQLSRNSDPDKYEGFKLRYVNPANGGHTMPTMATFLQLLPKGFKGENSRSTDSTIYHVVEGQGRVTIGGEHFMFGPKDIFVVPSWLPVSFETQSDTVLFSFSDRPVQEILGLFREARG